MKLAMVRIVLSIFSTRMLTVLWRFDSCTVWVCTVPSITARAAGDWSTLPKKASMHVVRLASCRQSS